MSALVFLFVFIGLIAVRVPISFALGIGGLAMAAAIPELDMVTALTLFAQRVFVGIDVFLLLAIPLFILAGALMEEGGAASRLVNFASALVGRFRGGLGHVTVLSTMFFSGISGSASADTAAVGSVMIPAMKRKGYHGPFSAVLTAGSGALGPIIPPSVLLVIYGAMGNMSVAALFLGGFIPGLIIGLGLMGLVFYMARKHDYPREEAVGPKVVFKRFVQAILALIMPLIILGGVFGGVFTATESAAVAVAYAIFLGIFVYKELTWSRLPGLFYATGLLSAKVMFLIAVATFIGFLFAHQRVPQMATQFLLTISNEPWVVLLLVNVLLLLIGCVLEVAAALIILGPVLIPVMQTIGVDPIHFGVVMVVNLAIGTVTPPVGNCLYIVSAISQESIIRCSVAALPVIAVMFAALMVITYVPETVLFIPRYFGY
ncbi:MAG: TRAP transporter large permease [Pseudomonadota bacterium]